LAQPISNKKSRWYKKQLLDKSDRMLMAKMEKLGHVFVSKKAQDIREAMRCAMQHVELMFSTRNGMRQTDTIYANRATLPSLGFRELGGGFLKLGHSTWKLNRDELGDVVLNRLEAETVDADRFPRRRGRTNSDPWTLMNAQLERLGYPRPIIYSMDLGTKMLYNQVPYRLPEGAVSVRGLQARVAAMEGSCFLMEYEGSGIRCFQPVASLIDPDKNSRFAAIQESVESRIALGVLTKLAQEEVKQELEADEALTKEDVDHFISSMESALKTALKERMSSKFAFITHGEQGSNTGLGPREAQSFEVKVPVHNLLEAQTLLKEWDISGERSEQDLVFLTHTGEYIGTSKWDDNTQAHRPIEVSKEARVAQNQHQWLDFNGSTICDFSDTLHGVIMPSGTEFVWELYEAGKLLDVGSALTEEEAREDCEYTAEKSQFDLRRSDLTDEDEDGTSISYIGKTIYNDLMSEPETGVVVAEVRDEFGAIRYLDVEYTSGRDGRVDLNFWELDPEGVITSVK